MSDPVRYRYVGPTRQSGGRFPPRDLTEAAIADWAARHDTPVATVYERLDRHPDYERVGESPAPAEATAAPEPDLAAVVHQVADAAETAVEALAELATAEPTDPTVPERPELVEEAQAALARIEEKLPGLNVREPTGRRAPGARTP